MVEVEGLEDLKTQKGYYPLKQTIVVRGDLNFGSKGKLIAQCCHASMGALLKYFKKSSTKIIDSPYQEYIGLVPIPVSEWIDGSFAKVVLKAPGLDDLLSLEKICKEDNIPHCLITDNGTTVFNNVPTVTCLAIGPWYSMAIEELTKNFKLL